MPNSLESLQTLLRMRQPSQVQTGDPWLARRQSEIASGMDELLPDADSPEYKFQQIEDAGRTGIALPRADYRSGHMAGLRRVLGLKQQEHDQNLEQEAVKGAYGIEANRAGQDAAMQRLLATQGSINSRSEADRSARESIAEERLRSLEAREEARNAAATGRTQMNIDATDARTEAKRPSSLWEKIFGRKAAAPTAPPTEEAPLGPGEFDFDPATGQYIPRR